MSNIVTKEGVTVKVGQVWRDLDKRFVRDAEVVFVDAELGKAHMRTGGRETKVSIKRMHKSSTGWALVWSAP